MHVVITYGLAVRQGIPLADWANIHNKIGDEYGQESGRYKE